MIRFMAALLITLAPSELFAFQSIYLVRHAEKLDLGKDPDLSPEGKTRAANLARMLKDSKISAIYTSEYKRTINTGAPAAEALKIKPVSINDTSKIIKALKDDKTDNTALVVGHSNTVPDILKAFGSDSKVEIGEKEFDRLYIITPQSNAKPIVHLIRY